MAGMKKPIKHGSREGWMAHWRRGEEACEPCKVANRAYTNDYQREHRSAVRATGRDPLANQKRQEKIRRRTLARLRELHPEDYRRLYEEVSHDLQEHDQA